MPVFPIYAQLHRWAQVERRPHSSLEVKVSSTLLIVKRDTLSRRTTSPQDHPFQRADREFRTPGTGYDR